MARERFKNAPGTAVGKQYVRRLDGSARERQAPAVCCREAPAKVRDGPRGTGQHGGGSTGSLWPIRINLGAWAPLAPIGRRAVLYVLPPLASVPPEPLRACVPTCCT